MPGNKEQKEPQWVYTFCNSYLTVYIYGDIQIEPDVCLPDAKNTHAVMQPTFFLMKCVNDW